MDSVQEVLKQASPELALLLACARPQLREEDSRRALAALERGIDWESFIRLAALHGLVPLVHLHVTRGTILVPKRISESLAERAAKNAQRSLQLVAELLLLLRCLADEGIPVVPLKGPILAQDVYGSPALRQMVDLDLLIPEAALQHLRRVLIAQGYQMDLGASPRLEALIRRGSHSVSSRSSSGVTVEWHHHLITPRGRVKWTYAAVAPRLTKTTFIGVPVSTLTPDDQFVYLCEHGSSHAWGRLEWLATVGELMQQRYGAGGARMTEAAHHFDATRRVATAVHLAAELLSICPMTQLPRARSSHPARTAVIRRLVRAPEHVRTTLSERFLYQIYTDANLQARAWRLRRTTVSRLSRGVSVVLNRKVGST